MITEEEAQEVLGLAASSSGFILVCASSLCDRLWWQLVAWVHSYRDEKLRAKQKVTRDTERSY